MRCARSPLWLVILLAGCTAHTPKYAGRPCSDQEPCGGGLRCDPVTHLCVEGGPAGDGPSDGRREQTAASDLPVVDHRLDQYRVPDGGCPSGRQQCGSICVNLSADYEHCSACDKPCPAGSTDTCRAGKCTCGQGEACTDGLNCVGGSCRCIAGSASLCAGCCSSTTSCTLIAAQSLGVCGSAGETCKSCDDKNECTTDSCSAGACSAKAVTDGTLCAGGTKVCTGGGCGGCAKQCGGKNCGPDGCGGDCGTCGGSSYCNSGTCAPCPTCASLGYFTGSLRGCTFDGSNDCTCPGTDLNGNNQCDSNESCWGWNNCSPGKYNPANCHTKKNINVPAGCPTISYCMECS